MLKLLPSTAKGVAALTWTLRIIVGAVFIFSGFVKLIDPWGTIYKFAEYFILWGYEFTRPVLLLCAVGLALIEFTSGVMLVCGAFRRTTAIILTVIMAVMTPLTLYLYLADPISDCGCFGEALVISNGLTFAKNIILAVMVIYLLVINHRVKGLIKPKVQWLGSFATIAYGSLIAWTGYTVQPLIDFRDFPVGTNISDVLAAAGGDTDGMVFVYSKNGVEKEFAADDIPDDESWVFVERREAEAHTSSDNIDFAVLDEEGQDVTSQVFDASGPELILVVSDPEQYGISRASKANVLADEMERRGGRMVALIASDYPGGIDAWREMTQAEYEVYAADDTDLKVLARGDAAMVYLQDGLIRWKRNVYSLSPRLDTELRDDPDMLDALTAIENSGRLEWWTLLYMIVMGAIIAMGYAIASVKLGVLKTPKPSLDADNTMTQDSDNAATSYTQTGDAPVDDTSLPEAKQE